MKTVYIELTEEQKEKLFPLFDGLMKANEKGEVALLLAQIHLTGCDAVANCRLIDSETSTRIQAAFNPKVVGKIVGEKHAKKSLAKARS